MKFVTKYLQLGGWGEVQEVEIGTYRYCKELAVEDEEK